jgi:lysophospholipase L1-like esterase
MKLPFALIGFTLVFLMSCFTNNSESTPDSEITPTMDSKLDSIIDSTMESKLDSTIDSNSISLRFLALGDSYTIGQGVPSDKGWPEQLVDSLGWKVDSLSVIARTGWTTNDLLRAVSQIDSGSFDIVTLQIGVNNQYRGMGFEFFTTQFDSLLHLSILYAGAKDRVITLSIPDYGYTPFGASRQEAISRDLNLYNDYIKEKSIDLGITHITITDISRSELGTLAQDDLHPSSDQYALWVQKLIPVVKQKLQ